MGKKEKSGLSKSGVSKRELKEMVAQFLGTHPNKSYTLKTLFRELNLKTHPLRMLCVDVLNDMLDDGFILHNYDGNIVYNGTEQTMEGLFRRTNGGRNFVVTDDNVTISVYDEDTRHAMPGDRVRVSVFAKRRYRIARIERPHGSGTLQQLHSDIIDLPVHCIRKPLRHSHSILRKTCKLHISYACMDRSALSDKRKLPVVYKDSKRRIKLF